MNWLLNYISDLFVFWNLKRISDGFLNLTDSKGKNHFFGDKKSFLKAKIKINNPSFCFNIVNICGNLSIIFSKKKYRKQNFFWS